MDEKIIQYYDNLERHIEGLDNHRAGLLELLEKARRASGTYTKHKVRRNRKKTSREIETDKSIEKVSFELRGLLQARQILYGIFPELQESSRLGVVIGTGSF